MIGKAKSISHGINDIRYITGESRNKKHPARIFHVGDNLLPPGLDATGIWDSMRLTLEKSRRVICCVSRIEGSHAASLLSPNVLIEVLYYLLRMENL